MFSEDLCSMLFASLLVSSCFCMIVKALHGFTIFYSLKGTNGFIKCLSIGSHKTSTLQCNPLIQNGLGPPKLYPISRKKRISEIHIYIYIYKAVSLNKRWKLCIVSFTTFFTRLLKISFEPSSQRFRIE